MFMLISEYLKRSKMKLNKISKLFFLRNSKIPNSSFGSILIAITFFNLNSLDTTFGSNYNGTVTTAIGSMSGAYCVAVQSNGYIVAGGNSNNSFALARYTGSGILDTAFGSSGLVTTTINGSEQINSIAIQSADQKIVAGGYSFDGSSNKFCLARYNTNGTLDTGNFGGSNGYVQTLIGSGASIGAIAIQSADGKIVAVGNASISGVPTIVVARYNTDGTLDTTNFGSPNGYITITIGNVCSVSSVAIDSSGNIIIAGTSDNQFMMAKLNSSGTLVSSFGTNGTVTTAIGSSAQANGVAIDNSGNIVVVGSSNNKFTIAQYNSGTGALITSFGSSGIVTTPIGTNSYANSVVIDGSGNIVVAGTSDNNFAVARYIDSTGALDTTFGGSGIITNSVGNTNCANSVAIQSNGNIIVAGSADTNFGLTSYVNSNQNSITINSPSNGSTLLRKFVSFSGTSNGNNSNVNVYLDGSLFSTVTTNASGAWSTGLTSLLADGNHSVLANLLNSSSGILAAYQNGFTIDTSTSSQWAIGNILRVDPIFGSDSDGVRGGAPFLTINGALGQAQSGDIVLLAPGTYNESFTIPNGVLVKGVSPSTCIIQQLNVTSNTDLVTMGTNCTLEDVQLNLTSASVSVTQLRGVVFPGTSSANSKILDCYVVVNNVAAGSSSTCNVYGIHSTGTGTSTPYNQAIVLSIIVVASAGSGNVRGLLNDQANSINALNSVFYVSTTGSGKAYGIEANNSGAIVNLNTTIISGSSADISQTSGTINLKGSILENTNANSLPFNNLKSPKTYIFGDSGPVSSGTTYLYPGTATASGSQVNLRVSQNMIAKALAINLASAPGTGNSITWTVLQNGTPTALTATISGTSTSALFNSSTVNFTAGSFISIEQVPSGANSAAGVIAVVDFY